MAQNKLCMSSIDIRVSLFWMYSIIQCNTYFQYQFGHFKEQKGIIKTRSGNSLIGFLSELLVFLRKNERMSDLLKKTSDLLIGSFLVSDLSDSLMVTQFWWANWANHSWSLIFGEQPEVFAHVALFWWVTWAIHSHFSLKKRKRANRSFLKIKNVYKTY